MARKNFSIIVKNSMIRILMTRTKRKYSHLFPVSKTKSYIGIIVFRTPFPSFLPTNIRWIIRYEYVIQMQTHATRISFKRSRYFTDYKIVSNICSAIHSYIYIPIRFCIYARNYNKVNNSLQSLKHLKKKILAISFSKRRDINFSRSLSTFFLSIFNFSFLQLLSLVYYF